MHKERNLWLSIYALLSPGPGGNETSEKRCEFQAPCASSLLMACLALRSLKTSRMGGDLPLQVPARRVGQRDQDEWGDDSLTTELSEDQVKPASWQDSFRISQNPWHKLGERSHLSFPRTGGGWGFGCAPPRGCSPKVSSGCACLKVLCARER